MKQNQEFKMPYLGVDLGLEYDLLYGLKGEFSVLIEIENPALQYCADEQQYQASHQVFSNVLKILGESHTLQKLDIIYKGSYSAPVSTDYLQRKYSEHFQGRTLNKIRTLLVLTRNPDQGNFYVFNKSALLEFKLAVDKVKDVLMAASMNPVALREKQINSHVLQTLAMHFGPGPFSLNNYRSGDEEIGLGQRSIRCMSLINTDEVELPAKLSGISYLSLSESLKGFPVDLMAFLFDMPDFDCVIFNQLIQVNDQRKTLSKLEVKMKRHSGIPDPANNLCTEDISALLEEVARESRLVVNAHFSLCICAENQQLSRCVNFIESALFSRGIIPSRNAYNQMELFRTILPGNAGELKNYDWFLTTADAALCFFFKERPQKSDASDFLVYFTDRAGLPIGIDFSDEPMQSGRINNRNKFVLGPSGSGKSFFMNSMLSQYAGYNMDIVVVDTGHSYSGLCSYLNGKYITYSDASPITMNPFLLDKDDYNIEKKDFLLTLICLCLRGVDGQVSQLERDVISAVINAYYLNWFSPVADGFEIKRLCFNSFYEFSVWKIPQIIQQEGIVFDVDEFRFILKKFYSGGEFESILNEAADVSLLEEKFIVFEIDNIKEHKILFPIVTLIIMDVFIQKMRLRNQQRKALIIEEAWKAVSSLLMASYLVYLFKTVRKFWGEVITVTQDLEDIIGNEIVKNTIISASDTVILLDQGKFRDNYDGISQLLSLSETERRKIFSINQLENKKKRGRFKEVYIRRGSLGEVYGVEVSLEQYLIFSTEKPEKNALTLYLIHFGSMEEALDNFISDFRHSGMSLPDFIRLVNSPSFTLK